MHKNIVTIMSVSHSHLVLIPSSNTGIKVLDTVHNALNAWQPVWVVIDGSTDATALSLSALAARDKNLKVFTLPYNQGKGAAVLHGLRAATEAGYTHVLTMDADGQHPPEKISEFMAMSQAYPDAMILGKPQFDASAPALRVRGRKISNWWANVETLGAGIGDSLFGFRVYPIKPLCEIMERSPWMRRFDFDVEAVVRLCWLGIRPINLPAAVRYFKVEEGGVSHFHYWRDNKLLTWMHVRLLCGFVLRLPLLLWRRFCPKNRIKCNH